MAFAVATPGHRHADAQVGLPGVAVQLYLERRQQQHEQCRAMGLGDLAQRPGQRLGQVEAEHRALPAGARRALVIGGQFQGRRLATQALQPVFQLALALPGRQQLALPGGAIGVLCGQHRQFAASATAMGVVAAGELIHQQVHRPPIGDDMVHAQQQAVVLGAQAQQGHPQQGARRQVVRGDGAGHAQLLGTGLALGRRQRGQIFIGQIQLGLGLDQQLRLAFHLVETAAQVLVTGDDGAQRGGHRLGVYWPVQLHGAVQVVGRCLGIELPDEPLPALRRRQRQGAIAGQARHRQPAHVDTGGHQLGQEQLLLVLRQLRQASADGQQLAVLRRYLGFEDTTHSACSSSSSKSFMKSTSSKSSAAGGALSSRAARAPTLG
ncbi:hypothetical protein KU43P_34710 [Pseudomonas sp. KU43P]|nr:hypothetical protein KU43P_34710 [Pseudomonas sp. KU43P]